MTRKYFTRCRLWYFPPPDKMTALARYANRYGRPEGRPYFSLNGREPVTEAQWSRMRAKWNHIHGLTNVWTEPAVRGLERLKAEGLKCLHMNQKPLKLLERVILASSDPGDIIWEPLGAFARRQWLVWQRAGIASARRSTVTISPSLQRD